MKLRTIALWEILGGTLILLANVLAMFPTAAPSTVRSVALMVITGFAIGALAVVAGLYLWRGSRVGIRLSIISQLLQVAWVTLPSIQFGSTLGPTLGVRITAASVSFNLGFYGRAGLGVQPSNAVGRFPLDITVNALAIVALIALVREYRKHVAKQPPATAAA